MDTATPPAIRRRRQSRHGVTVEDDSTKSRPQHATDEHWPSAIGPVWFRTLGDRAPSLAHIGRARPLTVENLFAASKLASLICGPAMVTMCGDRQMEVVLYGIRQLLSGLVPTARIWAQTALVDLAQRCMQGERISCFQLAQASVISLMLSSFDDIYRYLAYTEDERIKHDITSRLQLGFLAAKMSLPIAATSSTLLAPLVGDAGAFVGAHPYEEISGQFRILRPFDGIDQFLKATMASIRIFTSLVLLCVNMYNGTSRPLLLTGLCLAPSVFKLAGGVWNRRQSWTRRGDGLRAQERNLLELGKSDEFKQENVLFGLGSWIVQRLRHLHDDIWSERLNDPNRLSRLGVGLGQNGLETIFYLLVAARVLGDGLAFGTVRLYQSLARDLAEAIRAFLSALEDSYHNVFFLAAYIELSRLALKQESGLDARGTTMPAGSLTDYDRIRQGGVRIVARELSLTYPLMNTPSVHGINLCIEPGQTLAIVGSNGGGKSTLVKALMGLYEHEGELTLNGVCASTIDQRSFHRRVSCLFQDFSRYPLTLRENVGVGEIALMTDPDAIMRAIEQSGAGPVLHRLGDDLDQVLSPMLGKDASDVKSTLSNPGNKDGSEKSTVINPPIKPADATTHISKVSRGWSRALSGGQWQRVALARAFLRADCADLVVFDEPSSSLDPQAEAALFDRIHALSTTGARRATTIFISHRFSTGKCSALCSWLTSVRKADQIAVMEGGTIVEIGTHDHLMSLNGRYAELFNLQKEGYSD